MIGQSEARKLTTCIKNDNVKDVMQLVYLSQGSKPDVERFINELYAICNAIDDTVASEKLTMKTKK